MRSSFYRLTHTLVLSFVLLGTLLAFQATATAGIWWMKYYCTSDPTLEECQDMDWLNTNPCGIAEKSLMNNAYQKSVCNALLKEAADAEAELIPTSKVVTVDQFNNPAGIGPAKAYRNADARVNDVYMPGHIGGRVQGSQAADSQAVDQPAKPNPKKAQENALRQKWTNNSNDVDECYEVVFEKFYDLSLFSDETGAFQGEEREIFDIAFSFFNTDGSFGIGMKQIFGWNLQGRNGVEFPEGSEIIGEEGAVLIESFGDQIKPDKAKNAFFLMPIELIEDDSLAEDVAFGKKYWNGWPQAYPWHFHYILSLYMDSYTDYIDEELNRAEALNTGFRKALGKLEALKKKGNSSEINAQENVVQALFAEGEALGCLDIQTITSCDWSPKLFLTKVKNAYDNHKKGRQALYDVCLNATIFEDDEAMAFDSLKSAKFMLPGQVSLVDYVADNPIVGTMSFQTEAGSIPVNANGGADYTVSPEAIQTLAVHKELFQKAAAHKAKADAELLEATAPQLIDEDTGQIKAPGDTITGGHDYGNDDFGVYYNYEVNWKLNNITNGLCAINNQVKAYFKAGGTAFGKTKELIYANAELTIKEINIDFKVVGQSIDPFPFNEKGLEDLNYNIVEGAHPQQSGDMVSAQAWFTVLAIPVKVAGAIAGKIGVQLNFKAEAEYNVDPCSASAELGIEIRPYAGVDAWASVSIDFWIIEAGVKATLVLLDVALPFELTIGIYQENESIESLKFKVATSANFELEALSGKIKVYGKIGLCPFCVKGDATVFSWSGFRYDWELFSADYELNLDVLKSVMESQGGASPQPSIEVVPG